MEHRYQNIDGWFDFDDIYSEAVAAAQVDAVFVEVGSWLGRSAAFMGVEIVNSGKAIKFSCVDTWKGSATEPYHQGTVQAHGGSIRPAFELNMKGLPVVAIESESAAAASGFQDESIDFVFIDAAHDFASVSRDVRSWYPKVKPGGVIAGHDIGWAGLLPAVQSSIPAKEIEQRRSSWWHRKKSIEPIRTDSRALLFIPWVNREDLLEKAILSVPWSVQAVVVDHGQQLSLPLPAHFSRLSLPHRLRFSQIQNHMLRLASVSGIRELLFMHSDAECDPAVISQLADRAARESQWGVMFTNYDALAAFNVPWLLAQVGFWDETFEWYRADCDYYHRVRLAGLGLVDTGLPVRHAPSSTIQSDPIERARVDSLAAWHKSHYLHKWGGEDGGEKYQVPYNAPGF